MTTSAAMTRSGFRSRPAVEVFGEFVGPTARDEILAFEAALPEIESRFVAANRTARENLEEITGLLTATDESAQRMASRTWFQATWARLTGRERAESAEIRGISLACRLAGSSCSSGSSSVRSTWSRARSTSGHASSTFSSTTSRRSSRSSRWATGCSTASTRSRRACRPRNVGSLYEKIVAAGARISESAKVKWSGYPAHFALLRPHWFVVDQGFDAQHLEPVIKQVGEHAGIADVPIAPLALALMVLEEKRAWRLAEGGPRAHPPAPQAVDAAIPAEVGPPRPAPARDAARVPPRETRPARTPRASSRQERAASPDVVSAGGSLFEQMMDAAGVHPSDREYDVARRGLQAFVTEMLAPTRRGERVDEHVVDAMIAEIDQRMSAQINAILHHPDFQKLESAWRGLKYLVERVDFRENIRVSVLNISKEQLLWDFEDSPEIVKSGLYEHVYSNEYGEVGGKPYGVMVGDYEFGAGLQDMQLLRSIASLSAMSHAPFLANAAASMFGCESCTELPKLKDLQSIFKRAQYARWRSFRESEDSRYVGLCAPRFLLRLPYGPDTIPVKSFNFDEDVIEQHENYLWGHTSIALATRVADSFAKYRWAANIIGPQSGGAVDSLPLHQYEAKGKVQTKVPTEVRLDERREYVLSEQGFICLTHVREGRAAFFSANSCQTPKIFGNTAEAKAAETNYRLGTQLPYMFIITRFAHYLKILHRQHRTAWRYRSDIERELNNWIRQYAVDMETPAPAVRSRKPLRAAQIVIEDVEGQPGWYRCGVKVRPHFKYMGASFTLSLVGKLDKS